LPSVAVLSDGTVGVTYYDFRNDDGTGELADYWIVHCHSTCATAGNWGNEIRLTAAPFNYALAPFANGLFLGDYMGLASDGADFLAFFQQSSPTDPANGFFRRIGP
ncbi:MAG: exo-alpha-sialidase, partial [Acidimicrobiia bacterium]